jgi:hypothetical protein
MAFNINDFKSKFEETGVLQTNKYDVTINFENTALQTLSINNNLGGSTSSFSTVQDDLTYRCVAASIPGLTMRTTDVNRYGVGVLEKMPFSANYTDISLSFICDRYGNAYNFWYLWFNYIFGANGEETKSNVFGTIQDGAVGNAGRSFYTAEYKDNYAATIAINVYDTQGLNPIKVTLRKAYPVTINDVALSWTDNNNLIKLNTQITFREWDLNN